MAVAPQTWTRTTTPPTSASTILDLFLRTRQPSALRARGYSASRRRTRSAGFLPVRATRAPASTRSVRRGSSAVMAIRARPVTRALPTAAASLDRPIPARRRPLLSAQTRGRPLHTRLRVLVRRQRAARTRRHRRHVRSGATARQDYAALTLARMYPVTLRLRVDAMSPLARASRGHATIRSDPRVRHATTGTRARPTSSATRTERV
jgi:hypothetical protein